MVSARAWLKGVMDAEHQLARGRGLESVVRLDSGVWMRYILKGPVVCPSSVVEGVLWERFGGRSGMVIS